MVVDLSDKAPTGIAELDSLLSGGLPRHRGYLIQGPSESGKTLLAMRIQFEAIERGEPCVYVSYSSPYRDVIEKFKSSSMDIESHMAQGNFVLIDHYSLGTTSADVIHDGLSDVERCAVYFVGREIDDESYVAQMLRIREKIGTIGGINVIDDLSDYFRFTTAKKALARQERLKSLIARKAGGIGLHVHTPSSRRNSHRGYLKRVEDASMELARSPDRWLMTLNFGFMGITARTFELVSREGRLAIANEISRQGCGGSAASFLRRDLVDQGKHKKIRTLDMEKAQVTGLDIHGDTKTAWLRAIDASKARIVEARQLAEIEEIWDDYQKQVERIKLDN